MKINNMDLINQIAEVSGEIGTLIAELEKKRAQLDALTRQLAEQHHDETVVETVTADAVSTDDIVENAETADSIVADEAGNGDDNYHDGIAVIVADSINAAAAAGAKVCISDIRRVLTLNDKFRVKRELFGNNEQKFAEALQTINSLKSEHEVDEYIAAEIAPGNAPETVEEFAEIIKRNLTNKA